MIAEESCAMMKQDTKYQFSNLNERYQIADPRRIIGDRSVVDFTARLLLC